MRTGVALTGMLWLALMGGIVANHEVALRTGQELVLDTVPVDPRDLFRGDYVVLSYPMSTLDLSSVPNDLPVPQRGQLVYVELVTEAGRTVPRRVYARRPASASMVLRGRIRSAYTRQVQVEYGIESFFVPEGRGRPLETARGGALQVVAAVDRSGRAVIKSLRLNGKDVLFR
ncbi:MAG: GDYXXLXY domain-containing protein [Candidatus Omnitrophica bacterium]|nr:GDYXXLXY domain-containing protein [Candidatus Omnitrophota bacterium]